MTWSRAVTLCLLTVLVMDASSALMLDRLPRHIPRSKTAAPEDSSEENDLAETFDTSVEKKRIYQDPSQLAPFIMKPTWKAIYPFAVQDKLLQSKINQDKLIRGHKKRDAPELSADEEISDADQHELADILKDEEEGDKKEKKMTEKKKDVSHHAKTKRQSIEEVPETPEAKEIEPEEQEDAVPNKDFQEWLRREYYRNMARSFATMRRKRDGSSSHPKVKTVKRAKKSVESSDTLMEIADNLRSIEDQLFQDALQLMRDGGDDYENDVRRQNRISNDLSLAYDLETMRNAFFRLQDTLNNMEKEAELEEEERYRTSRKQEEEMYHTSRKRSRDCPSLDQLTSDCSSLSDIMPEAPLKRLLLRACNWHEVCYTCGKAYGLTSENCDGSFIEQTQTICQNDAPCESTANLLMVPLRQRRVFYKRSNPDVCIDDPCVEEFLKEGLAAMEEGQYAIRNDLNTIRHA